MVTGVLLTNIGSPKSPSLFDVGRYLIEFLSDKRVIDIPSFLRHFLVKGYIVPKRVYESSSAYKEIWTEQGSPLIAITRELAHRLQQALPNDYVVIIGMRYGKPSIKEALRTLKAKGIDNLIVLPLFPQYASATTGSSYAAVMQELSRWETIPSIRTISSAALLQRFIDATVAKACNTNLGEFDWFIFSFHGLPENQIRKHDPMKRCLLYNCCTSGGNAFCYRAQCLATAKALIERLKLNPDHCLITFQSRLGSGSWLKPYTQEIVVNLAKEYIKRVLVFTPSFTIDCLETIYEIGYECAESFYVYGGERFVRMESLNADPQWVVALKELILNEASTEARVLH